MAESYWPFDGVDTSETQYSQLFRRMQSTGVWGQDDDTEVKLVANNGLNLTLKAGYAMVLGYMYHNDADLGILETAGGTQARVDLLVLRLDPAANTIKAAILPGTPGTGLPPAPTQTDAGIYEMPIAQIAVAASASSISAANITDIRPFMGHIFGEWTTANRPKTPRKGQPGFNLTLVAPEFWDGAKWTPFLATTFTASQISDPQNLNVGNSTKVGGHNIFVKSSTPTADDNPQINDLWFW